MLLVTFLRVFASFYTTTYQVGDLGRFDAESRGSLITSSVLAFMTPVQW
jgi:hypothetical protein